MVRASNRAQALRWLRARIRRHKYRENPIENTALIVGAVLAVGAAAAIIFWPKKAAAASALPPPQQLTFQPGATQWYALSVGNSVTVNLPPGRDYHVDDFPGEAHSGGKIIQGKLNALDANGAGSMSFLAIGPGKATATIDTRGATKPMMISFEVV